MKLLETKNIKIGDIDYPCKLSVRASITFEELTGKDISQLSSLVDFVAAFYGSVKACGSKLTYDEFLDLIDNYPESLIEFKNTFTESTEKKEIPV
jgi:hypothetical protein